MNEEELRTLRQKVKEAHDNSLSREKEARRHYGSGVASFWQGKGEAYWNVWEWLNEIEDDTRR